MILVLHRVMQAWLLGVLVPPFNMEFHVVSESEVVITLATEIFGLHQVELFQDLYHLDLVLILYCMITCNASIFHAVSGCVLG